MTDHLKIARFDFNTEDIPWAHGQALYTLWKSLKGSRKWPARSDFKPTDMKAYLEHIMLINVEYEPLDFNVRLAGTGYTRFIPNDPTGMRIIDFNNGEASVARLEHLLKTECGYLGTDLPVAWTDTLHIYHYYDTLTLPLGETQERIDMVLMLVNYH